MMRYYIEHEVHGLKCGDGDCADVNVARNEAAKIAKSLLHCDFCKTRHKPESVRVVGSNGKCYFTSESSRK